MKTALPHRSSLAACILAFLLLTLGGCTGYRQPVYIPAEYPNSYKSYDLIIHWKTLSSPGSMTIAGFVRNTWPAAKLEMELTATLLTADSRELGQGTYLFFPHMIDIDEIVPFEIPITFSGSGQPERLRLFYRYRAGKLDDPANTFYQQVEVPLATPTR